MSARSDHVKRYAKKHKMSYREASMNAKCKEAYSKKRMSPRRMKMPPRAGGGAREDGRGRREEDGAGELPFLHPDIKSDILEFLNCRELAFFRHKMPDKFSIDNYLKKIMKTFKSKYPEIYNNETPGMAEFKATRKPTWEQFSGVCGEAFSIGNRLILEAAGNNQIESIENLIRAGISVNIPDQYGNTPLLEACEEGHLDIVQLLLDRGAYMNQEGHNGFSPLFAACQEGHLDIVQLLLDRGADMDRTTNRGVSPLWVACRNGRLDVARLLIDNGADVNKANDRGETPLLIACYFGHLEAVRLLLEKGANPRGSGISPLTPLGAAVSGGNTEIAEILRTHL